MIRIAIAGASGRMGRMLIEAVQEADDCTLGAALDRLLAEPDGVAPLLHRGRLEASAADYPAAVLALNATVVTDRRSIGIVTFNGEQQRLIENLLDQERRQHPELEPFFDPARWHEPVFVKNLENVQGDERDVIIFSSTFGSNGTAVTTESVAYIEPRDIVVVHDFSRSMNFDSYFNDEQSVTLP